MITLFYENNLIILFKTILLIIMIINKIIL
jgi:hypothetical protein